MADNIQKVEVAVTVIHCQGRLLAVLNPQWGAFTLPMTKHRPWEGSGGTRGLRTRIWEHAAVRNVAEWLGTTATHRVMFLMDIAEFRQSDRDGQVKPYHFQVFHYPLERPPQRVCGIAEWLLPADFLDPRRKPISPTADFLIRQMQANAKLRDLPFPPADPPQPNTIGPRSSSAAVALIRREDRDGVKWLAQWNMNWRHYFFVGGHKEDDESFRECVVRKIEDELGLLDGQHYQIKGSQRLSKFRHFSIAAQQETQYEMELFDVDLHNPKSENLIGANAGNCWLTALEIKRHQAADLRPVSEMMELLLKMAGQLT